MAVVHSFDVFDTSLIRKVAAPTDVFRLLGARIARKAHIADQSDFIEEFLSARIQAEQKARFHREETTLDQIWANLREMMPQLPSNFGSRDELDIEEELLSPNSIVAQQIAELRSAGARIIFTSDTYLPEEFVRKQLLRYGVAEPGEKIYASSAFGVTKWRGGLFKLILDSESILARELHHYGDNPESDVIVPRRLGIETTLWTDSQLNIWERAILSRDDRIATSLLAGSMRAFRLSAAQSMTASDELVATFLGPALMVWAAWVLGTAQRDGVRRLYFVSRDGYLLCRAARVLTSHFGNIDCRYLQISRQSILLPATDEVSQSKMNWLLRPPNPTPIAYFAEKLGLNWSDVASHFSSLAAGQGKLKLLSRGGDREWNAFWDIIQNAPIADLLREQIRNRRANVLAYLRAEGLFDEIPIGVVDLGWNAMVLTGLRKLLRLGQRKSTASGYYLGLNVTRMVPADAGKVTALFYEGAPDHRHISPEYQVFQRIDILENVLGLAPHGSVREHRVNGAIVEAVCPRESASHVELVGKLGNAIEAFCERNKNDVSYYSDNSTAREIIDALVSAWCLRPNKASLNSLEHVVAVEGTNNVLSQPLLQPWRFVEAAKTLMPARLRDKLGIRVRRTLWPEAAFQRSGILAKFVLRLATALKLAKRALRGRNAR